MKDLTGLHSNNMLPDLQENMYMPCVCNILEVDDFSNLISRNSSEVRGVGEKLGRRDTIREGEI